MEIAAGFRVFFFSAAARCCLDTQSEDGLPSAWWRLCGPNAAPWIFRLRSVCHWLFHGKEALQLSAMGNVFGCVRVPKEECHVDPKNAPLRPEPKELKGRRYFQRKKRKSGALQPVEPLSNPGCEAAGISRQHPNDPDWTREEETHLSRPESLSRGVYVGEEPVFIIRESQHQPRKETTPNTSTDCDRSRSTVDASLHDINATSRVAPGGGGLIRRQRGRSASFGAVEHTLQTLRRSHRSGREEAAAEIRWGRQANRRRRASACSGCIRHDPPSGHHKVNQ